MLPGIRFVLATMLLTVSLAICGLGATALLRAAQQNSADLPALQAMRDPFPPTLAMLQVEAPAPVSEADQSAKTDSANNETVVAATESAQTETVAAIATISEGQAAVDMPSQMASTVTAPTETTIETPALAEQRPSPPTTSADSSELTNKVEASDPTALPHDPTATASTVVASGQSAPTASGEKSSTGTDLVTGSINPAATTTTRSAAAGNAKKARLARRVRARRVARAIAPRQQPAAKQASQLGF